MARSIKDWLLRVHQPVMRGEVVTESNPSRLCFAPETERYAIENKGTPHENAVAIMRAFVAGERPSFLQAKEAAGLLLEMLDHLNSKLSYQTCQVHGPVKATDVWACGKCYEAAVVELEVKK